jgi:hypothetical protein
MNFQVFKHPWKHCVIDGLVNNNLLDRLIDICYNIPLTNNIIRYSIIISHNRKCYKSVDSSYSDLSNTYDWTDVLPYELSLDIFDSIRDNYLILCEEFNIEIPTNWGILFEYQTSGWKCETGIHTDQPWKMLSTVLYVNPTDSVGTLLYNTDRSPYSNVEWTVGKCLSFKGQDGVTYHNVPRTQDERTILNMILVDMDGDWDIIGDEYERRD